jgi:hypothetical protein
MRRSRWRAPLITLAVVVAIILGAMHFLSTGSFRDAMMSLHGHRLGH